MTQAFFTSIGGITAAQSKIDVVSDNIANMNTVAFKESQLTFQNVFSNTLTTGSAPTNSMGGSNPRQIGLGVTIGSISRNFKSGTIQTTGKNTDLNIQGGGFFTVQGSDGDIQYTRAGNFTLDSEGNFVTSSGQKILGTNTLFSETGSLETVFVPPKLGLTTKGSDLSAAGAPGLADLNGASVNKGDFIISVETGGDTVDVTVDISGCNNLSDVAAAINAKMLATGDLVHPDLSGVSASVGSDGTFSIEYDTAGTGTPSSISMKSGSSNFLSETNLATATGATTGTVTEFTSKVLHYEASVEPPDNIANTQTMSSFSVGNNGAVEVTYSNGDKISVESEGNNRVLIYTTATGVKINAGNITVTGDALKAANLQLQMGKVVNEHGLVSQGGNVFSTGPNSGDMTFSIGNDNGFGKVASGGLESSNVNLSSQFAEMILAQRAIDANSRTFTAMNEVMRKVVQLGR